MNNYAIITKGNESKQIFAEEMFSSNGYILPFFDFQTVLDLYYSNTYHRRCILTKAHLLSQIDETDLNLYLQPGISPKQFLNAFVRDLGIYGTAFMEIAGTPKMRRFYHLPALEGRIDRDYEVWQSSAYGDQPLDNGVFLAYYSPKSRYYGEPDYLATTMQMLIEEKIHLYNAAFFDNKALPDMAVLFEGSEPSKEQMEAMQVFFGTSLKGYLNAHKTLLLSAPAGLNGEKPTIRFEKLNEISDMSFAKLREATRDEIIAAHNMPPRLVGVISAGQLGGGGEMIGQLHTFNEIEIKPKIELLEYWFGNQGVKLKLKPLDVSTYKDDSDVVQGLVSAGIITQQEARDVMGWGK